MLNGTGDTPGPLCSILTCRGNSSHGPSVHVIAAGRANHAGTGGPWGAVPRDDGNTYAVGHEIAHTVDEAWSSAQMEQVTRAEAAILRRLKAKTSNGLPSHSEYAPDRKIDTTEGKYGQSMKAERADVQAAIDGDAGDEGEEPMKYWNVQRATPLELADDVWTRVPFDKDASDDGKWHQEGNAGVYVKDGLIQCSAILRLDGPGRIEARIARAPSGSKVGDGQGTVMGGPFEGDGGVTIFAPPFNGSTEGVFVEVRAASAAVLDYIQFRGTVSPRG